MIQLMEEQTAGLFSKQLGRFMIRNMAQLTAWSMTGSAQLMSIAMIKIGELLENTIFDQRKNPLEGWREVADDDREDIVDYDDQLEAVNETVCVTDYHV